MEDRQLQRSDFFLQSIYGKYLIASVLAMLATSVSGMIDTVIVGCFMSETGLSAMSLLSPVYLVYYTIGAVVGVGGSIAANLAIGRNDYASYKRIFTLSFWSAIAFAALMTGLGLVFIDQLVRLLGGSGELVPLMHDYLFWYILFGGFTLVIYLPLNFLKMEGRPQASTFLFLLSSLLNVLLTWLFMSPVCGMGIKGASIATGMSMGITALIGLWILFVKTANTRLVSLRGAPVGKLLADIAACGSPNGCHNLFTALRIMIINGVILGMGAQLYLPAFAIIKSISDLLTGIVAGVASALMPIVGVYFGERDRESIRRVCRKALQLGGAITLAAAALTAAIPGLICSLFNISEPEIMRSGIFGLRCLAASFAFGFFNLMLSGYFNTVKRPMLSDLILGLRFIVYLAPAALLLGRAVGIDGVWLAFIAAEALTLFTIAVVMAAIRRKNPGLDLLLLEGSPEQEISFSVENDLEDIVFASEKMSEFGEMCGMDMKTTMRLSLAIEEMLTVIISYCMDRAKKQYIDIRIVKLEDGVLLRIRNTGRIFDPVRFYEENRDNEEMADSVLGIKLIAGTAKEIEFHDTFGTNNLLIRF